MRRNEINRTRVAVRERERESKRIGKTCSAFDAENIVRNINRGMDYGKKRCKKDKGFFENNLSFLCANEKGITLLALILTVVIMIILAAVTINVALGEGGLVDQAKWAAEQTANSTKSEQEQLDDVADQINDIIAGIGTGETNSTGGEETNSVETNTVETNTIEPEPEPIPEGTITIGEAQWQENGTANVSITSSESKYIIQYQINGTDEKSWLTISGGVVTGVNHGDTVYARLTDGEQYSEIQNKKIEDTTVPEKANIEINPESVIIGENITAKVTHIDRESGVNISQSKWVLTQSAEEIGTGSDVISQYTGSFTTNSETITLNSGTTGTYYLHVLTTDVAGNKTETVSNAITVKVITGTVSQKGSTTWSNGKASIELETADNQFEIEYKVNEGGWTKYDGAITGLNHGDKITARLTNETTTGPENTFTIEDKKAPVVTVTAGGSTTNSITVRVTAEDKESGMKGNPTYTYQIKQSSQGEEKYQTPSDANNITSNSYTFKNLTQGTSYDVKVEVNGDVAGNTGIGTLANQNTGTVPGGEGGIEQGAITFGTATWQDGKASVTIATNTGLQIQYQKNATETNSWTNIENNGTVANLNHGDTIYARLTDGTNYGEYASINIIDNEEPEKATIELNTTNILIGENITAKVTHKDIKSGVDIGKSGWIMNTSSSAMGTEDTAAYTGKFTTNPETITLNSSAEGTYYLHVLTIDKAGNKTETVSNGITISRITGTVTQEGEITWSGGTATLKLATTESQYKIVYKINGEGSWQEYNGTSITGLNHGDKVKACLTNEGQTTYGPEVNITIEDTIAPVVTVTAQGSPTTNSITVTAQAVDNETGMVTSPKYTYYIKKSTEEDENYKALSGAENISNAQYTFTGLTQGTNYDIKVEVNGDKAGNIGIGTLTNQTTATVPGAGEGLETGNITASPAVWNEGKASITLTTTTSFQIEYQVGGISGSWTKGNSPVTVGNLNHGDTVYARLTDGINAGNSASITILDKKAPTVELVVDEVTAESITVSVSASDGESGLADTNTYKYYLNNSLKSTTSNKSYTFSSLSAEMEYTIKVEVYDKAGNAGVDTKQAITFKSYVGYYADVDGNGTVDGVIYADLAIGGSGEWNPGNNSDRERGKYTIPKGSNFKKYKVSKSGYSGDFGTKDVLTVANSSGNERFYVMALDDIDSSRHYWYNNAYGNMNDYASTTSTSFGSGKQNTKNMIAKWNSSGYGSQTTSGSYSDMWGLSAVQSGTWNGASGWYVPSREEWAAFGGQLGITQSNYENKGLSDWCWSSSQGDTSHAWHASFYSGCMGSNTVGNRSYVRLGATF